MLSITQLCGVESSDGHGDFIHQSTIHRSGQIINIQKIRNFQDIVKASLRNNPCFLTKSEKKNNLLKSLDFYLSFLLLDEALTFVEAELYVELKSMVRSSKRGMMRYGA